MKAFTPEELAKLLDRYRIHALENPEDYGDLESADRYGERLVEILDSMRIPQTVHSVIRSELEAFYEVAQVAVAALEVLLAEHMTVCTSQATDETLIRLGVDGRMTLKNRVVATHLSEELQKCRDVEARLKGRLR